MSNICSKESNVRAQTEHMLYNTTLLTEMALDMKEKCNASEKYVSNLRNFAIRACKTLTSIQNTNKSFLQLAQKLTLSAIKMIDTLPPNEQKCFAIKCEFERLSNILEKELLEYEDNDSFDTALCQSFTELDLKNVSEKIRNLEEKQKQNDSCVYSTTSSKSFRSDIDEKYPEKLNKDSVMDLDNVINLPSVPEDIFTTCTQPKRTSSLSSLKNLRKVKLFLHRAECMSDEDEERDDWDDNNITRFGMGDTEERDADVRNFSPVKTNTQLGDIKEEI